jgi:amidase
VPGDLNALIELRCHNRTKHHERTECAPLGQAFLATTRKLKVIMPKTTISTQDFELVEATIADMQAAMSRGEISSKTLVEAYLERIERHKHLNAVIETNPDALKIADALDRERRSSGARGPLHGVPILLKDNLDTRDRMHTSAGSLAMAKSRALRDSTVAARLREAGAVLLGKANMTEWANFMTVGMPSGYSSRGGQGVNPYKPGLDTGGSSSGSGIAPAANLCAAAIGTETSGSILSPANQNSLVGIKPTVGLVSRVGVIPISSTQDTPGPMARTVRDAALLLSALVGQDKRDAATRGSPVTGLHYTQFLGMDDLRGERIGVPRNVYWDDLSDDQKKILEHAISVLRGLGATVIDPAEIVTAREAASFHFEVLLYDFKRDINCYFRSLGPNAPIKNLRELIAYNEARPAKMLRYGQLILQAAQSTSGTLKEKVYAYRRAEDLRLSQRLGIDATMKKHRLSALVFPAYHGYAIAARPGYPSVIVPAGFTPDNAPVGITFTGQSWSEPLLLRLAYAFEQATKARRAPPI